VVKDPERFAAEVIPEYFKHNNFASFVRQLNFYGFRKIKSDPIRIKDAETSEESKFWKFRHEHFQRGRADLLSRIRKSGHNEIADKKEVETLRHEVFDLRNTIACMADDIEKLKTLVGSLMKNQQIQHINGFGQEQPVKKRKSEDLCQPDPVFSGSMEPEFEKPSLTPLPVASDEASVDMDVETLLGTSMGIPAASQSLALEHSIGAKTNATVDEDVLQSLFELDTSEDFNVLDNVGFPEITFKKMDSVRERNDVDPKLLEKLRDALSKLPKEMQTLFVDRIAIYMNDPDSLAMQVDAITALANSAAEEAHSRLLATGTNPSDKHVATLGAAVLAAYLSSYVSEEHKTENNMDLSSTDGISGKQLYV
jgi:hypothetical protein